LGPRYNVAVDDVQEPNVWGGNSIIYCSSISIRSWWWYWWWKL